MFSIQEQCSWILLSVYFLTLLAKLNWRISLCTLPIYIVVRLLEHYNIELFMYNFLLEISVSALALFTPT